MEDINSDGKWIFISLSCLGILLISFVALLAVLIVVSGAILLKSLFCRDESTSVQLSFK